MCRWEGILCSSQRWSRSTCLSRSVIYIVVLCMCVYYMYSIHMCIRYILFGLYTHILMCIIIIYIHIVLNTRGSPYIALICQGAWGVTLLLLPFSSFSSLLDYFGPVCILFVVALISS